ncbi:hypothetical protein M8J75_009829 [Diaphorina citri]|nr:hypothetical protein M8J75_009829 [Diaphorina citri]
MSSSWFLVLFTFFLTVNVLLAEPTKRSKHRGHRGEDSTPDVPLNVASVDGAHVGVRSNESRIIVPTEDPVKYDGAKVFRVFVTNAKGRKRVNDLTDKGVAEKWGGSTSNIDIMVKADKVAAVKQYLEKAKLTYEVILEDVQRAINEENPEISEEELAVLTGRKGHRMTFHKYHRMEDIHGYLDYLAQTYPQLVTLTDIGRSLEGRPLRLVKISSGVPNAKAFWIDGGIHAREWITPATVSFILSELVENREAQEDYIKKIDFYVLPITNPDGYEYTHTTERLWRKNRRKSPKGDSCSGIDLNRNWGFHWGGVGSSKEQCQQIYAGTGPFSEPETQAVSRFILANNANMKAFVTFHSYGQYILYPWGYNKKVPPDYADLDRVGRAAAEAMRVAGGGAYTVGNSAQLLYPAAELRDKGNYGFLLPASHILPVGRESLAAIKAIAREF